MEKHVLAAAEASSQQPGGWAGWEAEPLSHIHVPAASWQFNRKLMGILSRDDSARLLLTPGFRNRAK